MSRRSFFVEPRRQQRAACSCAQPDERAEQKECIHYDSAARRFVVVSASIFVFLFRELGMLYGAPRSRAARNGTSQ